MRAFVLIRVPAVQLPQRLTLEIESPHVANSCFTKLGFPVMILSNTVSAMFCLKI